MPGNIKKYKSVLIGLIILFTFSIVKTDGEDTLRPSTGIPLRQLSIKEIFELLHQFPELVPEYLPASVREAIFVKKDSTVIMDVFPFREINDVNILKTVFPTTHFYIKKLYGAKPPPKYLIAVGGNKVYGMPGMFNRLLLDNNIIANDSKAIEIAEAFIVTAVYGEARIRVYYPEINFLEGTKINEWDSSRCTQMDVKIKCRIGDEPSTWKFTLSKVAGQEDQPVIARKFVNDSIVKYYMIKTAERKKSE